MRRLKRPRWGVLILSHGRADKVLTLRSLRKSGYSGPVVALIDNEDPTADDYRKEFGPENVVVFDKAGISETFDEGDNFSDRRAIIYARNASFKVARDLGWTHFIQLDDDYSYWAWNFDSSLKHAYSRILSLDAVFESMIRFLQTTPAATIAMAQAGDHIGGPLNTGLSSVNIGRGGKRKAMNTFVCDVNREIGFVGRINEDVNTYTRKGSTGELFFTLNFVQITQRNTQQGEGGMTGLYKDSGTYVKSFYTVMYMPSCATVQPLSSVHSRWHHSIKWRNCTPKILREKHRRPC